MKTKLLLLLVVLLPLAAHAADDLSTALQKGLFEEEANQNLPAAIKAYESLLAASDEQRKLTATALFRLGECYRKLGKTNDAVAQYQRLLRDYADQNPLATLSRQNLTGLGLTLNPAGSGTTSMSAQAEAQRLLIERLELEIKTAEAEVAGYERMIQEKVVPANSADKVRARLLDLRRQLVMARDSGSTTAAHSGEAVGAEALLKQLREMSQSELRSVLPTVAPDALLSSLLERAADAQRRLASARTTFTDEHPTAKAVVAELKILEGQIDERLQGILKGLEIKAAALKQQTTAAGGGGGGGRTGTAASVNEEDQEIRRIQALIKDSPDLINALNVDIAKPPSSDRLAQRKSSLLHKAASEGQVGVAKFLLGLGAVVDVRDDVDQTPLHWAVGNGHKAMVELLLASKADVNARSSMSGSYPLHLAVRQGYRAVCETLLERGADPNLGDADGTPPIYSAVWRGDEATLRLLLSKGAKVNPPPGKKSYTPLHHAASTNIARILIENGAVVDALNNENRSPLHVNAQNGNREMAELLLSAGANPRLKDNNGITPLHLAAENRRAGVVAPLIAKGADPNERDASGRVPLDHLIRLNDNRSRDTIRTPQLETLEALLTGGADPNLTGASGIPHLYRAVDGGFEDLAETLLKAGADPNAKATLESQNKKDLTALTRALWGGSKQRSISLVNLLLEHKADPNLADGHGNTPLFLAIVNGGQEVPFVEALLKRGADVEGWNSEGETPLIVAVNRPMKEMVALLLKNKADPNGKSRSGSTPLHRAASKQDGDILELLLAAGADPNALNAEGKSPLDYVKAPASRPGTGSIGGFGPRLVPVPLPPAVGGPPPTLPPDQTALADRLRKAGARDWAPRPGLITVTRRSTGASQVIFTKGTNDWNRYSLLELMGYTYFGSDTKFPFPDFSKVRITRADASAVGGLREFTVDLPAALAKDGCKADQALEWGDLIDIPEGEHKLGEKWSGLNSADAGAISKCLTRSVTIVVKGKSNEVPLAAGQWRSTHGANGVITYSPDQPFTLRHTVLNSGLLLTSSDMTRVKVARSDATAGLKEWTFDISKEPSAGNDLWLRDGDRIEVPERP